jgi:ketosteroid isomerase-like protein
MRPSALALIVALLAPAALAAQTSAPSDVAAVLKLDSLWARNYATNDTASAGRLMADDFFMTSTDGSTKNKATEMRDVAPAANIAMKYFRTTQVRARVYGTGAVVTGAAEWAFDQGGNEVAVRRRYTAVYAKGGPLGWQLVALHMGRAP